jgi:hypothetical protein
MASNFDYRDMSDERKKRIIATKEALYRYEVAPLVKKGIDIGVVPPKLQPDFMTKKLAPHQVAGLKRVPFGRQQQVYDDGSVHDVEKAITHLQTELVGFFVEAPLNWGMETQVNGNPTKETAVGVDVAAVGKKHGVRQELG